MDITYRPLVSADAAAYWALVNEVKDEGEFLFATLRFPLADTEKYLALHQSNGSPIWGAFAADALVGWIDYNRGGFPEVAHTAGIGMGVQKDYRGRGIGTALLERCAESAREAGIEKLELEVFGSNARAYALYRKFGFQEEGRRAKKRLYQGAYDDLVMMGLFLG